MNLDQGGDSETRFAEFVAGLGSVIGHAERTRPLRDYCTGRGWRGFHHHATLCIAAYGFLIAEQAMIPPSGRRSAAPVQVPPLPDDYRPRGSAFAA